MKVFPLTARFTNSHDKSFVVMESLILIPLIAIMVSSACRRLGLSDFISISLGIIVAILLIRQYSKYIWVPGRRNPDGVSSTAGDDGDRHVLEAMSGPADKGADAERGPPPRQDQ